MCVCVCVCVCMYILNSSWQRILIYSKSHRLLHIDMPVMFKTTKNTGIPATGTMGLLNSDHRGINSICLYFYFVCEGMHEDNDASKK